MKKYILILSLFFVGLGVKAQVTYGFAAKSYDNFNNGDTSAAIELVVLIPNNDTLKTVVGSTISPIDGTAKNGTHYSFTQQNFTFNPGSTNWNNSNRKKFKLNLTIDPVFWGTRDFKIVLSNFVGIVPATQLINNQTELIVIIDYDGSSLNVPTLSIHDYKLYPVPATEKLTIEGVDASYYSITDLSGRLVQQGTVFGNQVDVNHLNNGLYILRASTNKGVIMQKFLKQ